MKLVISPEDRNRRFVEARNQEIKKPFVWNNHEFQVNQESQFHINTKALSVIRAQLANDTLPSLVWRTLDNTFYQFQDADEFLNFASAVEQHIENILVNSWIKIDNN